MKRRGWLIAAVAGSLVLGGLLLMLAARRGRHPHISHQLPYRWDQYPRPNLHVEMKPWIDLVAEVNAAMSEASQGEITEAVKFDTTPTRIVKVNCSPELEPHADEFIAAYRESWLQWKQGFVDVVFPTGTYALAKIAAVTCAPP